MKEEPKGGLMHANPDDWGDAVTDLYECSDSVLTDGMIESK